MWVTQPAYLRKRDVANILVIAGCLKVIYLCDGEHGLNVLLEEELSDMKFKFQDVAEYTEGPDGAPRYEKRPTRKVKTAEYDMSEFLKSCCDRYEELCGEGGVVWEKVATPFMAGSGEPGPPQVLR